MIRLNPRVDFAFKKLFGDENDSDECQIYEDRLKLRRDVLTEMKMAVDSSLKEAKLETARNC